MTQFGTRQVGIGFAAAAVTIWTGFILVSRQGTLSALAYTDIIAIRYGTSTLILLPCWWFLGRFNLLQPKYLISGLLGGLGYAVSAFKGFAVTPASHAAVLLPGSMPLFVILATTLLQRQFHHGMQWLGIGVISLGIVLLLGDVVSASGLGSGHAWFLLASGFWSLFSVCIKRWALTPWEAIVSLSMVTALLYLPIYGAFLYDPETAFVLSDVLLQAGYQGILATILQMYCYVMAVRALGPAAVGALMALVPVLAGLLAIWIFAEPLTMTLLIAMVLVSVGCWLANANLPWRSKTLCRTST